MNEIREIFFELSASERIHRSIEGRQKRHEHVIRSIQRCAEILIFYFDEHSQNSKSAVEADDDCV